MLTVIEALHRVLENAAAKPAHEIDLSDALGLVLAEDVASDIDSPPHDKSMVDGYAVLTADLVDGRAQLVVLEEITAGKVPTRAVIPGFCTRIMTGAPLPDGANSVVMIERTQHISSPLYSGGRGVGGEGENLGSVHLHDDQFRAGQNVMLRGKSLRRGDVVLRSGAEMGPAEIGLLAEVGRARIQAIGPVRVAVLSTGNELVPLDERPAAGQIRNSNGPLLAAAARRSGAAPVDLGIARDEVDELRRLIRRGLEDDVLLISGGVSAGVLDLVPAVLTELGVRQVFHKVQLKPGKPLWFGICDRPTPHYPSTLVFGLPGNPVSSLVCFELFVKPAIARIAGRHWEPPHRTQPAKLTREFTHRGDRPTYYPAVITTSPEGLLVEPTAWQGSADLRGFAGANSLIEFPAGDHSYQPGDSVEVLTLQ